MTTDPILRVRRLALSAMLTAGGQPTAAQYRRAALQPSSYLTTAQGEALPRDQDRVDETRPRGRRRPGPQF